jgi:hypothetical protein
MYRTYLSNEYYCFFFVVFEARYSEMEWMVTKNVDKDKEDAEPEGDFVSVLFSGLLQNPDPHYVCRYLVGTVLSIETL